jgi:hypothetical protein
MITVKLSGGLGNQMFQYALGRSLSLGRKVPLALDISHYNTYHDKKYALDCFNIPATVQIGGPPRMYYDFNLGNPLSKAKQTLKFLGGAPKRVSEKGFSYELTGLVGSALEPAGGFDTSVLEAGKNTYLVGFWQDERYFNKHQSPLRMDFSFKEALSKNAKDLKLAINRSRAISVHVRRADYIENSVINETMEVLSPQFYERAAEQFAKKVDQPVFIIFSDDIEWCKQNLNFKHPTLFSDKRLRDWEDMYLMSICKHNIIANSTFSWWAAWLNQNPNKLVAAPKNWFRDKNLKDPELPEGWIKL